jgi:hypothetical protein
MRLSLRRLKTYQESGRGWDPSCHEEQELQHTVFAELSK